MSEAQGWNDKIIAEFRANGGKVSGSFEGAPLLLLTTTGRRSGQPRTNPLMYLPDGDRWLVFASYAGAPRHPDWYRNLLAEPRATIEVGTETVPVSASVLERVERDHFYAEQARQVPGFAEYEKRTSRVIPVVALRRR